jgi:hypothetical protein
MIEGSEAGKRASVVMPSIGTSAQSAGARGEATGREARGQEETQMQNREKRAARMPDDARFKEWEEA